MFKFLPIGVVMMFTAGCAVAPEQGGTAKFGLLRPVAASAPTAAPAAGRGDIQVMASFQPGVSTVTDAVRVLGVPSHVNNSPDGRFVYMYDFASTPQGPMLAGMLFGPNQVLIKIDYFPHRK